MKKRAPRIGFSDLGFHICVYFIAVFAFLITIYPFLYILSVSLSDGVAIDRGQVFLWPVHFTLSGYEQVIKQTGLWTCYFNTIYYTVIGTVFNIGATVLAAFPLSRKSFSGRRTFNFLIVFCMYFSGGLIPSYLMITQLGFYNTRWVMIIPSLISSFNVMICRSAFSEIPNEIIESACVDGANDWSILGRIAFRLITPTLAVLTLYYAVFHWNDFMTPLLYISKNDLMPMQVILRRVLIQGSEELVQQTQYDYNMRSVVSLQLRYVTIVITILPILLIYPLLQRYFVKGIMLGAVKG